MVKQLSYDKLNMGVCIFAIIFMVAITLIMFNEANAKTKQGATMIGITLSDSCMRSISCPTYQELETQFDNSNQYLSGEFGIGKDGKYQRLPTKFKNHWNWYHYTNINPLIFVDPDAHLIKVLDVHIIVEPTNFTYINPKEHKTIEQFVERAYVNCTHFINGECVKSVNGTVKERIEPFRVENHNRYIIGCEFARVQYSLLLETVNYFYSNCKGDKLNDREIINMPQLPVDYSQHKWYAYTEWMRNAQNQCKEKC